MLGAYAYRKRGTAMKTDGQVKSDERDNNRVIRWIIFAIAVLLAASLSYSFFSRQKIAEEHSEPRVVNIASQGGIESENPPTRLV